MDTEKKTPSPPLEGGDIKAPAWAEKIADFVPEFTWKEIAILTTSGIIPPECPAARAALFLKFVQSKGLNVFDKHIYLVKYGNSFQNVTSIDGARFLADKNEGIHGSEDYIFNATTRYDADRDIYIVEGLSEFQCIEQSGKYKLTLPPKSNNNDYKIGRTWHKPGAEVEFLTPPKTATFIGYKLVNGQRVRYWATSAWDEYFTTGADEFIWRMFPFNQLGKTAEMKTYRKGWAASLGGIYLREEFQKVVEAHAEVLPDTVTVALQKLNALPSGDKDGLRQLYHDTPELSGNAVWEKVFSEKLNAVGGPEKVLVKTDAAPAENVNYMDLPVDEMEVTP